MMTFIHVPLSSLSAVSGTTNKFQWRGKFTGLPHQMPRNILVSISLVYVDWLCGYSCPVDVCGRAFAMSHHCKAHQLLRHGMPTSDHCFPL